MPRPRPPHLYKETTRHGKQVWYVRVGKGPRTRIEHRYGTREFWAAYLSATADTSPRPRRGTLRWLVAEYRESTAWEQLSAATRSQRANIFRAVLDRAGDNPYASISRADIVAGRDRRTPSQGKHFISTMRGLFRWAVDAGHVAEDPTETIKRAPIKTRGFPSWSEDDVRAFEKRWRVGTKERLAFDLLLYTGLRRGDACRICSDHIRDGVITIATQKTGEVVSIPILPELQRSMKAVGVEDFLITGAGGRPMTKESFGNWFRDACREAGVKKSAHGLRKAGATRAANAGATEAELEALFGWRGGKMAALYTRNADRERLARGAIARLARPHPAERVKNGGRKT